jgi:TRAP-type mannitol/chloroaromatic compound transport system permease large subunit
VLGVTAATMILLDPAVVPQIIGLIPFGGANNYLLVAALLFMIAGEVMNQGRIAEKLIAFASSLVGHIRGGLAHVNILTSLFFSEISGTATSDAAAIGSVMIPQMKKRGYPVAFAAAVTPSTKAMGRPAISRTTRRIRMIQPGSRNITRRFRAGGHRGRPVRSGDRQAA